MPIHTDQLNRLVHLPDIPQRIISLVPSQTELLFDLGLDDSVVGITRFCVHPAHWFRTKQRIGGTKDVKMERVRSLQPDLVIANKEENLRGQVETLEKEYPVWISDVHDLPSALNMIHQVGEMCGKQETGRQLAVKIEHAFRELHPLPAPLNIAYLIWKNPYMTVGSDTFIHAMLAQCGFSNVFAGANRYPAISLEELKARQPDVLFLSSEPYPFSEKDIEELRPQLPGTRIMLVNGEYFSWYGSRLLHAPPYFNHLLANCS